MTRTRAVIALTLSSLLALGACSDDDPEPRLAPPSSSAPGSPSASPSGEGEPAPPPVAATLNQGGAERFVRYWFRTLSHSMVTGDTTDLHASSARTCTSCTALIEQIDGLYAKGGRVETQGWEVEASRVNGEFDDGSPSFLLRVVERQRVLYDGDRLVDRTPMTKVPMHIELSHPTGRWVVSGLEILA